MMFVGAAEARTSTSLAWSLAPVEVPAGELLVGPMQPLFRQPLVPPAVAKPATAFREPTTGDIVVPEHARLYKSHVSSREYCLIDPVPTSNRVPCLGDQDGDGRFDRFVWRKIADRTLPVIPTSMPKNAVSIDPVPFSVSKANPSDSPYYVEVYYTGRVGLSRTASVGVRVSHVGKRLGAYAGPPIALDADRLPILISGKGARITVTSFNGDQLTARVDSAFTPGPFDLPELPQPRVIYIPVYR